MTQDNRVESDPTIALPWTIEDAEDGTPMIVKDGAMRRPATEEEQDAYMILNLRGARIRDLLVKVDAANAYFQERADYFKALYR